MPTFIGVSIKLIVIMGSMFDIFFIIGIIEKDAADFLIQFTMSVQNCGRLVEVLSNSGSHSQNLGD